MDPELREQIIEECKIKCTCPCYDSSRMKRRGSTPAPCDEKECKNDYDGDQRTFFTFVTETISVIAFLVFGSVVFWLAVGGILFDFFKKLYYSDRYVKIFIAGLFTFLLLSMSVRVLLNKRACKAAYLREKEKKEAAAMAPVEPPKPPPEYMVVSLDDKNSQKKKNVEEVEHQPDIQKKFTLTIVNEKKREVYKESKTFFIPAMAMEMKKPPPIIVYLKNLILEDY